jgi:hypothetical protein
MRYGISLGCLGAARFCMNAALLRWTAVGRPWRNQLIQKNAEHVDQRNIDWSTSLFAGGSTHGAGQAKPEMISMIKTQPLRQALDMVRTARDASAETVSQ